MLSLGRSDRWYDYQSVDIRYYQAKFDEFRARRIFHNGAPSLGVDDRDYDLVFGHFDIPTHTAHLWACGPNLGNSPELNIVVR